ncbi:MULTISPECIES: hypothetical protein [unclassified Streptomyces]|uniref:hypothetical protein n=1 Tax=unclassified Streptomyces TaxID=2593676 RepID=UPI00338E81C0
MQRGVRWSPHPTTTYSSAVPSPAPTSSSTCQAGQRHDHTSPAARQGRGRQADGCRTGRVGASRRHSGQRPDTDHLHPLHPRVIEQRMRRRPDLAHRSPDGTQGGLDRASGLVRAGVTDFAQQTLGDVIVVARPRHGETVQAGQTCGDIEQPDHGEETAGPMPDSVSVPEFLRTRQRSVGGPLGPDQVLLGRRRVVLRDGEEGEEEGGFLHWAGAADEAEGGRWLTRVGRRPDPVRGSGGGRGGHREAEDGRRPPRNRPPEALAPGQCGTWLSDGLAGADLIAPLVRAGPAGGLQSAAASILLTAHRRSLS